MAVGRPREALIEDILDWQQRLRRGALLVQGPPPLEIDVSMSQLKMLFAIGSMATPAGTDGARVSDLARVLSITPATASVSVERLVDRGLVDRREDPLDRRQHRCRLSAEGERVLVLVSEQMQLLTRRLLSVLSADELETVLRGHEVLFRAVERLTDAPVPAGHG